METRDRGRQLVHPELAPDQYHELSYAQVSAAGSARQHNGNVYQTILLATQDEFEQAKQILDREFRQQQEESLSRRMDETMDEMQRFESFMRELWQHLQDNRGQNLTLPEFPAMAHRRQDVARYEGSQLRGINMEADDVESLASLVTFVTAMGGTEIVPSQMSDMEQRPASQDALESTDSALLSREKPSGFDQRRRLTENAMKTIPGPESIQANRSISFGHETKEEVSETLYARAVPTQKSSSYRNHGPAISRSTSIEDPDISYRAQLHSFRRRVLRKISDLFFMIKMPYKRWRASATYRPDTSRSRQHSAYHERKPRRHAVYGTSVEHSSPQNPRPTRTHYRGSMGPQALDDATRGSDDDLPPRRGKVRAYLPSPYHENGGRDYRDPCNEDSVNAISDTGRGRDSIAGLRTELDTMSDTEPEVQRQRSGFSTHTTEDGDDMEKQLARATVPVWSDHLASYDGSESALLDVLRPWMARQLEAGGFDVARIYKSESEEE